jgi:hypothetical protein
LRSDRAGRPLKQWVTTVSVNVGSASASWWVCDAPLSWLRSSRVPTATASAPASSSSRTAPEPSTPPAATTGSLLTARTERTTSAVDDPAIGRWGSKVPL